MEHFERIKAISFDAGSTLFQLRRPVGEVYAEVAWAEGVEIDAEVATRAFREILPTLRSRPDGDRPEDDRGFWRQIVLAVLERCGAADDPVVAGRIFNSAYERYRGAAEWILFPETIPVLRKLAQRWPLLIISNYDGRIHETLEALDIRSFFTKVIVSSEVGSEKPAAGIYRKALERLGLAAGDVLHVGDEPEADYEGARKAGLRAWLVERPQTTLETLLQLVDQPA